MEFKFSNQTDFIRSITVGLVFIPYHFICDVARKLVFLRREKIESALLGSVCFSAGITAVTLVYYFFINKIYLFDGQFPLVVPLASTIILFMIYAVFKESTFKLYDDLQDFVLLDSVLSAAVSENNSMDVTADVQDLTANMQEITDEPEITDDPDQAQVNPDYQPSFNVAPAMPSGNPGAQQPISPESRIPSIPLDDLRIDENSLEAALSAASNVMPNVSPAVQSAAASFEDRSVLSKEAKKSLYKNKMLFALKDRLETVKSARNLPDEELTRVYNEQIFIFESDFRQDIFEMEIDDLLLDE